MRLAKWNMTEMWSVDGWFLVIAPGKFRRLDNYEAAYQYYIQLIGE